MKKTEKIIASLLTIAFGVLLIALQDSIVSILITVLGVALIAFGVMDIINRLFPPAIVKFVAGIVIIICSWTIVEAVLYIVAALLLIAGILILYAKIKRQVQCSTWYHTLCEYAIPALFIVIGLLLLFNQCDNAGWVFVVGGILVIVEGALLLVNAVTDD